MTKGGFVYMLASKSCGTLYIGVTNDLVRRVWEHKSGTVPGFTKRYATKDLVWFERYDDIRDAIVREKAIKKWRRAWKIECIQASNPVWRDLLTEETLTQVVIPAKAGIHFAVRMDPRVRGRDGLCLTETTCVIPGKGR